MADVCEHVPLDADTATMVLLAPAAGQVEVKCPCCHLRAQREPDVDLVGDNCPYCGVQAVLV